MKKPLLPEWRYWPAIALAALIGAAVWGHIASLAPFGDTHSYYVYQKGIVSEPAYAWHWIAKDSISLFTAILALFTGALVYVSVKELQFLRRSDETAAELKEIARKQMVIAGQQADIQLKQQQIQRMQFIAMHRPRVRISGLQWVSNAASLEPDHKYRVQFVYRNEGETAAKILEIGTAVVWATARRTSVPNFPAVSRFTQETVNCELEPGEAQLATTADTFSWDSFFLEVAKNRGAFIFCVGYIRYEDDRQIEHTTGFCRRWEFEPARWERHPDEEYEYAY